MKQKMHLLDRIFMTGIWISPLVLYGLYKYMELTRPYDTITSYPWPMMVLVSLLPPMYVFSGNLIAAASGQDTFGPQDTNVDRPNAFRSATGKERAMYPDEFPSVLLHKEPAGIVLGKCLGKRKTVYLCKPPGDKAGSHVLIIGNSGSGKSSCQIIPTLLAKGNTKVLCIDIKGELSENSEKLDSVIRIDPQNRDSWGWDPLYELQETSSEQEILQCMQGIAYSLIPLPADVKEPFWKVNARNLLTGLLIGYYKAGLKDFISLVDAILEIPAKDSIATLIDKAKPGAVEKKYLGSFDGMADDTLSGVVSEYTQSLMVFLDADVRYMMQVNRKKAHPGMLVDLSKSVYICIKEHMLEPYYNLLQLMLSQCLFALQKQENMTAEPCMVIIDELPRMCSQGKIEHLLDGMHTLRSKNVNLILVTQNLEALETAYTKSQVSDLMSNASYLICLDCRSSETATAICKMAGTYKEKELSWNGTGPKGHISTSYKDKDILEPADLSKLILRGEAVLISPYGYYRVGKVPYYSDPWFKPKWQAIKKYNDEIKSIRSNKDSINKNKSKNISNH